MKALWKVPLAVILGAGCGQPQPVVFPTHATAPEPFVPRADAPTAFDTMWLAGLRVQTDDPEGSARVHFTPGQRRQALLRSEGSVQQLEASLDQPLEYEFKPVGTFQLSPQLPGWRHLARVLVWRMEDALDAGEEQAGSRWAELGVIFATQLFKGGAAEADLGLTLLDDLRVSLASRLDKLSPSELGGLRQRFAAVLPEDDWLDRAVHNERANMLQAVQFVQDSFRNKDDKALRQKLGPEVREALEYLDGLRGKSGSEQVAYFTGFAAEVDLEIQLMRSQLASPIGRRVKLVDPEGRRPWRRFAKHFFRTLRPLVTRYDRTLTRTRLLLLTMYVEATLRETGAAPDTLQAVPQALRTDPFSGGPMGYKADGPTFKVYSFGTDQRDSGGQTDAEGLSPDLVLEPQG